MMLFYVEVSRWGILLYRISGSVCFRACRVLRWHCLHPCYVHRSFWTLELKPVTFCIVFWTDLLIWNKIQTSASGLLWASPRAACNRFCLCCIHSIAFGLFSLPSTITGSSYHGLFSMKIKKVMRNFTVKCLGWSWWPQSNPSALKPAGFKPCATCFPGVLLSVIHWEEHKLPAGLKTVYWIFAFLQQTRGFVAVSKPYNGCSEITNPEALKEKIALMQRGQCMFAEKARNIQKAGAIGGIVIGK